MRFWSGAGAVGGGEDEEEVPVGILGEGGKGGVCWGNYPADDAGDGRGIRGVARR